MITIRDMLSSSDYVLIVADEANLRSCREDEFCGLMSVGGIRIVRGFVMRLKRSDLPAPRGKFLNLRDDD